MRHLQNKLYRVSLCRQRKISNLNRTLKNYFFVMTEITSKIESIRNMKEDLKSIKITAQKNTDKMFQDLADFRNRIRNEMSNMGYVYHQSGGSHTRQDNRKEADRSQAIRTFDSDSDYYNETLQCPESKRMSFILNEIENVQKKSKQMLIELENYSEPVAGLSTSVSKMRVGPQNKENYLSTTNSLVNESTPHEVTILFSKQLPYNTSDSEQTNKIVRSNTSISDPGKNAPVNANNFENENYVPTENSNGDLSKDKIDRLTKKLKEIQTQNDELRHVNENIQNLLMKLSDLEYVSADAETVEKLQTVNRESHTSDVTYLPEIDSDTVLNNDNYQKCVRSVQMTNKTSQGNMLTKIKVAKLIIKRIRSCTNIADQEQKYQIRVRQAEQSITFKAHHKKPKY